MIYPLFAMVFLTFVVGMYLFRLRYKAVKTKQVSIGYFRLNSGAEPPTALLQAARNYSNLLELPLLFYVAVMLILVLRLETPTLIIVAWLFVLSRIGHSWIHLTSNNVIHRLIAFMFGALCLLIIWGLVIAATILRGALPS